MSSLKAIKSRIKSVKNTKKVTKTMELISAIKFQKAFAEIEHMNNFKNRLEFVNLELNRGIEISDSSDLENNTNSEVWVVISSDRGLAGDYITNIKRFLLANLQNKSKNHIKFILIGKKIAPLISRLGFEILDIYKTLDDSKMVEFSDLLRNKLSIYNKSNSLVKLLFPRFGASAKINVVSEDLFEDTLQKELESVSSFKFEPSESELRNYVSSEIVKIKILSALKHSNISENYSRMVSMKSATQNAGEIINNLVLDYNKTRQNNITQEISEIIGGMMDQNEETEKNFSNKILINISK